MRSNAMARSVILAAGLAAAALSLAAAPALTAAEAKKQFFGFDMRGKLTEADEPFRECIDSTGKTKFWFEGSVDEGRLTIRSDGALCFAYKSRNFQDPACFAAYREGKQFRFVSDGGGAVWVTSATRRVTSCVADVPVS
jgi:hypothetical protein